MYTLNQKLFLIVNANAGENRFIDLLMLTSAEGIPYLVIGVLFYLWFSHRRHEALYAGYAATVGVGINFLITLFFFHNRPFMDRLGHPLLAHAPDSSFPSDHATFTFSIALMLLTFKTTRTVGIILTSLALACGMARVYVGVHYPLDIAGSFVVSMIAVWIIHSFESRLKYFNEQLIGLWNRLAGVLRALV